MNIREALTRGGAVLKTAGIDSAALDASLLLAEVLGKSRAALIAAAPENISEENLNRFWQLIERRRGGECTAYILGKKEFYGLDFTVSPAALVPRPDTETLVEAALAELRRYAKRGAPLRVLDLCTGSGAIAAALKHTMPNLAVWGADISEAALAIAKINAARLLPPGEDPIQFRQGNLFEALCPRKTQAEARPRFSLIVSNPPYVSSGEIAGLPPEVQNEPRLALDGGSGGLDIITAIIARAPAYLDRGGVLLLEADPRQMQEIAALLKKAGFSSVQTYRDLSGQERAIGVRV